MQLYRLVLKREREDVPDFHVRGDSPRDLLPLIKEIVKEEAQEVVLGFYFAGKKLIGFSEISRGGFSWVRADHKVLFSTAMLCGADTVIMAHNHPSGFARPSRADVRAVKKAVAAGELMQIYIVDHLIVGEDEYMSMAEFGLMPSVRDAMKQADEEREKELDRLDK